MKNLLLVLTLVFAFTLPLSATITEGDTAYGFVVGPTMSVATDTGTHNHAAGAVLIVWCASSVPSSATVSSVTDVAGDTFIGPAAGKRLTDNGWRIEWFYVLATIGNASNTVTCNWSSSLPQNVLTVVWEFNYTGTLTFDLAITSNPETFGASYPTQTFSTTGAGFVFYFAHCETSNPTGAPNGWTEFAGPGQAYLITTMAESNLQPAATGASQVWSSGAIAFLESAPSGGSSSGRLKLR